MVLTTIEVTLTTTEAIREGLSPSQTHQLPICNAFGALRCPFFIARTYGNVWSTGRNVWSNSKNPGFHCPGSSAVWSNAWSIFLLQLGVSSHSRAVGATCNAIACTPADSGNPQID